MTVYNKFRTPFFSIEISSYNLARSVVLPPSMLSLVEKIEVFDSLDPEMHPFASIVFVEGSREPSQTLGNRKFNISSGQLSNSPGALTDITFGTGKADTKLVKTSKGKSSSTRYETTSVDPLYLFQNGNIVTITFGYKEDKASVRNVSFMITAVTVDYPDTNAVITTLLCQSAEPLINRKVAIQGKKFAVLQNASYSTIPIPNLVRDIAQKLGIKATISPNFPLVGVATAEDKDAVTGINSGESLHQFLTRLAHSNNAYYRMVINPSTKKHEIIFLYRPEYEKATIQSGKLFWFKTPGSIIKSVKVNADYAAPQGSSQVSTDSSGEQVQTDSNNPVSQQLAISKQGKKEKYLSTSSDGIDIASDATLAKIFGTDSKGKPNVCEGTAEIVPFENPSKQQATVEADTGNIYSRALTIEMTLLGYTKLIPGVIEVQNIGQRFSGTYRVLNVKHTIDSSGYVTQVTGSGFFSKNGVVPEESAESDSLVDVQLAESKQSSGSSIVSNSALTKQIKTIFGL